MKRWDFLALAFLCWGFSALVAALWIAGCGEDTRGVPLPAEYRERYARVEKCLERRAIEPRLLLSETAECPGTDNWRCCLAGHGSFSGLYYADRDLIQLPDECDVAFEAEAVHHVLRRTGESRWKDHSHPAFAACGGTA